ncbi:MAG TPA: hypothetical protein VHA56_09340 [Mucilaginibacter sp.]|nr:hypothetical protein [Mucilaginibacter sp.]
MKTKKNNIEPAFDWERAKPERLPKPTYWPFFAAVGFTFIFWGLLTTWVVLTAGLLMVMISIWGWINILRHE